MDQLKRSDIKPSKITLAPAQELVHFLAVFHRAFLAIEQAAVENDREAMLLGAGVANALHNVPGRLIHHHPAGSRHIDDRPEVFPRLVQEHAPARIAALCAHIFSSDGDPEELGLSPDLNDLELALPHKLQEFVRILGGSCLGLRQMSNYGEAEPIRLTPKEHWPAAADEHGAFNGQLAHLLQPIPAGLVCWDRFDEKAFWRDAKQLWHRVPYRYYTPWDKYFERNQRWWYCFLPKGTRPWMSYQLSRGIG